MSGENMEKVLQDIHAGMNTPVAADVLIVDDVHANIFLVESILSGKYTYAGVRSSSEMWRWLKQNTPRVILLDLMMPFQDGFEILAALREDARLASVPVIVVTAKDEADDVMRVMKLGARDYVVKPVREDVLLLKIEKHIK